MSQQNEFKLSILISFSGNSLSLYDEQAGVGGFADIITSVLEINEVHCWSMNMTVKDAHIEVIQRQSITNHSTV